MNNFDARINHKTDYDSSEVKSIINGLASSSEVSSSQEETSEYDENNTLQALNKSRKSYDRYFSQLTDLILRAYDFSYE